MPVLLYFALSGAVNLFLILKNDLINGVVFKMKKTETNAKAPLKKVPLLF